MVDIIDKAPQKLDLVPLLGGDFKYFWNGHPEDENPF